MSTTLTTTNKVAAAAVGVAMVFSFAFVTPAQASTDTVDALAAQIASLLATISGLQAQLAAMTGGTVTTGSYNFTLSHEMGDEGSDVINIQKFLNANGFAVSATGAGSPGNETSYFGGRTKQAVIAFQNANAAAILAPVGLSAGTGYWGPSSRAYANSMGGSVVTPGTPAVPTGTGLSVASAAQPANSLAPESASNLPFTKFSVTNNSGSAQTISGVTVQLGGLANKAAFSSLVLLDEAGIQIGNTRTINSNDQATVGESMTLQPGETRVLTIGANMGGTLTSYAGQIATLSVVSVNTSATVAGSLPISGASHTINASLAIGAVTAQRGPEDPAAAQSKEIGTTGYTFTSVKLTNNGSAENVRLNSIRFDQAGSASASDIVNVMAYVDGVAYSPVISGDVYTFSFGSGIVINEGLSKEVVLKGDIAGGTSRTISFNVYKYTDINVTGETFGYGITPTDGGSGFVSSGTPAYDASDVDILAGTFNSVSKSNAAPSANIAIQTSEQILGAFTVDIKGEGVTVQTVTMVATIATSTGSAFGTSLDNVTLVDQNGTVLAGPVDATGSSGTTGNLSFSSVSFPTGVTTVFVKGFLDSTFGANDTIVMSTTPSNWTDATGDDTGDTVTLSGLSTATANTMTVQAATLTATTLTQPAARNIVPGATDFVFATVTLDAANSGEDVRVTAVIVEDTTASSGDGVDLDNVEIWANLSGGSSNDSVRGDRFETRVADAEQMAGTGNTDNTLSISLDTHIIVPKNTSVDIAVVADLSSSADASDKHTVSLDEITGTSSVTSAVTAVGAVSGNTINLTTATSGQTMTVSASGTLTITVDSSTPNTGDLILDSTAEQTSVVFRLAADNVENLDVDSIKLTSDGTDDAVAKYVFYNGATKLGEVTGGQDTAELFLTDGTLTVPADDYVLVTVKVVMNPIDGTQVKNGDTVTTTIDLAGDVDTTGADSGSAVDNTATSTDGNLLTMYEAYPEFAFDNSGVSTVLGASANYLAAKIVITNVGDKDIIFDGGDSLQINFEIGQGSLTTASNAVFAVETSSGNTLDTVNMGTITGSTSADIVFATNTLTITAGSSEEIQIRVDTGGLTANGDTLQAWLSDDAAANMTFRVDGDSADYSEGDITFKGDIFGPTHVNPS